MPNEELPNHVRFAKQFGCHTTFSKSLYGRKHRLLDIVYGVYIKTQNINHTSNIEDTNSILSQWYVYRVWPAFPQKNI